MAQILIIAGHDSSGHAGLVRDVSVVSSKGFWPAVVLTALTVQSKTRFFSSRVVSKSFLKQQLQSWSSVNQFSAVKIGMLGDGSIVKTVAGFLSRRKIPVVLDPVLVSTTGGRLLSKAGAKLMLDCLVPKTSLWTPNVAEASYFFERGIQSKKDVLEAAHFLFSKTNTPLLIKGLVWEKKVYDFFMDSNHKRWFLSPLLPNHPRGTGCALASFLACALGKGMSIEQAVMKGRKDFKHWLSFKS